MKRLTLLAVALTMVLGMAASAFAAPEVTVSGNILINAVWRSNWDFNDGDAPAGADDDAFTIQERLDLGFTAVANENLKAVIVFRSVRGNLGQGDLADGAGGAAGGGGGTVILGLNQGYIDFNWPGTSVNIKAGFQPVALPASVGGGSLIQDDIASGVLVSTAFNDNVSMLAGWVRFFDTPDAAANDIDEAQIDGLILALPLSYEGFAATPFLVYAAPGQNALQSAPAGLAAFGTVGTDEFEGAWWLGSNLELSMLDPFIIKADLNYGAVNADNDRSERDGWLFDAAVEYTGFDFMNLELAFAYTTGEDDDATDGSERLPILSDSWALGTTFFGAGLITGDDMGDNDNVGFWALALSATGIQSFAEGLTHDAHIVYAQGTNDEDAAAAPAGLTYGRSLTENETMLEIDFNTFYKIYDELTLYNGIGYVNIDGDDDGIVRAADEDGGDAWKFQLGLKYVF
ncbi:outer membrane homotrimeric porin [Pseudodesulfovibrio portus]|uniref:Porin n=1 Tax=Pseudodesulfovibrio portus TaxID=231439 RepID=A0ABM8AP22_9BACT|nr:outer membrane homotrimeric porin [Pseudodesulfovibrio portus]BDQ33133.1 hypothetical protein JCM14722_06750 [Pseudodesulfovibrio portus]